MHRSILATEPCHVYRWIAFLMLGDFIWEPYICIHRSVTSVTACICQPTGLCSLPQPNMPLIWVATMGLHACTHVCVSPSHSMLTIKILHMCYRVLWAWPCPRSMHVALPTSNPCSKLPTSHTAADVKYVLYFVHGSVSMILCLAQVITQLSVRKP